MKVQAEPRGTTGLEPSAEEAREAERSSNSGVKLWLVVAAFFSAVR